MKYPVNCSSCHEIFDRGYNQNSTRKKKPQFCSSFCRKDTAGKKAANQRIARFWVKVKKTSLCWEWAAFVNSRGYGQFQYASGKPILAHRYSYTITYGPIPSGLFVCHKCDNPKCVRPDHLFVGTAKENTADCVAKGRLCRKPRVIGSDVNTSKLTKAQAIDVYQSPLPTKVLATKYGISGTAVRLIKIGKNWRHATGHHNAST